MLKQKILYLLPDLNSTIIRYLPPAAIASPTPITIFKFHDN